MNKRVLKINKKKIKTRKTWTRNPNTQVEPNKRIQDEPFDDSLYRGQKISQDDFDIYDDDMEELERGIK